MAWKCSECGAVEGKDKVLVEMREEEAVILAICHHCGKPLCQKDRALIRDDDFNGTMITAYHCEDCRKVFHPNAIIERG